MILPQPSSDHAQVTIEAGPRHIVRNLRGTASIASIPLRTNTGSQPRDRSGRPSSEVPARELHERPSRRALLGCFVRVGACALGLGLLRFTLRPALARANGPRIGFLGNADANQDRIEALKNGLLDLGYVDGSNVSIEWRFAEANNARFDELAADLLALPVDIIVAGNAPAAVAAHSATRSVPIVLASVNDPVGLGLVASLDDPGGNITGTTIYAPQLIARRLEILGRLVPGLTRVAILVNGANPNNPPQFETLQAAGDAFGVVVQNLDVRSVDDLDSAFTAAARWGAEGLLNGVDSLINSMRSRIAALAAQHALPALYTDREYVQAGGLMAFGPGHLEGYRNAATYIDKILRGAKPADLPIQQPTTFELVANRAAAADLGLVISPPEASMITEWFD